MDKSEFIPPIGVIAVMGVIIMISVINQYNEGFDFALGIIIGACLYLCYLFYREFKQEKDNIKKGT